MAQFWNQVLLISRGLGTTVGLFALTLLFSMPLGMGIAFGRMSKIAPVRWFFQLYISVLRGTPLMLQLLIVYFGPPLLLGPSFSYNNFIAAVIAFTLNYAAYFAEIYRGGIESIADGQREAAAVLGLSRNQTFIRIVLPQVIKRIMSATTNEIVTLVKDTSLAQVIAVAEILTLAKQQENFLVSMMPLFIAGVFYYVMNAVVAFGCGRVEKKLNYYR